MIDYNVNSPMGSFFNTVQGFQGLESNRMQLGQQRQQQQLQDRTQELMPLVKSGDYDATIELSTINPQIAESVTKAKASMKEGQEAQIANWLAGYQTAPDKEAYLAEDLPGVDIDDNFRGMDPEQRDSLTKIVGAQVMPKTMFEATFGGQSAPSYQSVQYDSEGNPFGLNKDTGKFEQIGGGFVKGKSGPQTVVNNITGKPQSEFDKETQKINARAYSDINKTNNSIRAEENKIKQLQRLNEKAFSGPLANEKLSAAKLAGKFGIDVDGLPESEAFRAVSNELVLDKSQQMSGALSEGDMAFLQNTVPNLGNSKEGRASVFDYSQKLIDRQKEYAKQARKFTKEKGYFDLGEFESDFQQYADENPLFDGESQSNAGANEQQNQGAPKVGSVVDGWTYNGGDPADPNSWSEK